MVVSYALTSVCLSGFAGLTLCATTTQVGSHQCQVASFISGLAPDHILLSLDIPPLTSMWCLT